MRLTLGLTARQGVKAEHFSPGTCLHQATPSVRGGVIGCGTAEPTVPAFFVFANQWCVAATHHRPFEFRSDGHARQGQLVMKAMFAQSGAVPERPHFHHR
jgi:hypothetical protein